VATRVGGSRPHSSRGFQLRHSSIQVTVDICGHPIPGANRQAADRVDDGRNLGATGKDEGVAA